MRIVNLAVQGINQNMKSIFPYIHRDISWLQFNYRVLQEAKDKNVPLLERVKFLAIFSSNLDEFFRVRVANHRNVVRAGKKAQKNLAFEPEEVLTQILKLVAEHQVEFSDIYQNQIVPSLAKEHINIHRIEDLSPKQIEFIDSYYLDKLQPYVIPIVLRGKKIKPFLNNAAIYLAVQLVDKEDAAKQYNALLKIPSKESPRFVILPPTSPHKHEVILLDEIIKYSTKYIFPGYNIVGMYSIKLTRDAELYIDDEYSGDLIAKVKKSLEKRKVGIASRLVHDRDMPKPLLAYLMDVFDISDYDLSPEGKQHNNSDFFGFPTFNLSNLQDKTLYPLPYHKLEKLKSVLDGIEINDHLIHYPYQSYESVIRFFEDAATDPDVTHIKIIQYRVAKKSRIMEALMRAVRNGKKVFAFIEIKARFDEKANLEWGEKLEEAGVKVRYSIPGLKVHSKMALVSKQVNGQVKDYIYVSTGNFNESTAKLYADIGLFTSDQRLTAEARMFLKFLESKTPPKLPFKHLGVGQFNLNKMLEKLIDYEIKEAKKGNKARIILKLNSLQDKEMIEKLYEASMAGVKIKLIIRGICSLVAGIKKVSENIEVISIVDRFLEHARVFWFYRSGKENIYLSSADFMERNLHRRFETVVPVYSEELKKTILDILKLQLQDNVKARLIESGKTNTYKSNEKSVVRSQLESYHYFKRLNELEAWS